MFFILSKILFFLLVPFNWIIASLVGYCFTKSRKWKKILLTVAISTFIIFSNPLIYRWCSLAWQPAPPPTKYSEKFSTGIVLCGMTMQDRHNQRFFGGVSDRFIQTAKLYHTGVISRIFVSGGSGSLQPKGIKEAVFLRNEFIAQGVPDSCIFIEDLSRNTYESAVAAKYFLDSANVKPPYLLITSALHIPRSLKVFEKAGISVIPHAASFEVIDSEYNIIAGITPSLSALDKWKFLLKELVGSLVYKATGKL